MASSNQYNSQSDRSSQRTSQQHNEQQYPSQQMPYSQLSQYSSQPGAYQTLSTTTQGYQQRPGAAYSVSQGASYPGGPVPYSGVQPLSAARSASVPQAGGQYAAQPTPGSQYMGHPQQPAYGTAAQYSYPHQANQPPVSSHTARYLPGSLPGMQADHHGRRSSASSMHQVQSPPSPDLERHACDRCDKTFSRSHDRKRHYETQHSSNPPIHPCQFCHKCFSRPDSLKRHIDNGCDKDPSFTGPSSST